MDYLTKWLEVFPTRDQTSLAIARLLVDMLSAARLDCYLREEPPFFQR